MTKRYQIFTGKKLSKEKYLETWNLDNVTFERKYKINKEFAIKLYEYSNHSTIVLWDNKNNELIGYITPFFLDHSSSTQYIINQQNYKSFLKKENFVKLKRGTCGDIYIFSCVVKENYRDVKLPIKNKKSSMYGKTAFKVLNEALVDWICHIKEAGASIRYVFSEKTTDDGEKYLKSLNMQPCLALKNDCKYAKAFSPSMFYMCSNVQKLYDINEKESYSMFDNSLLNNHEYLSVKNNVLYYKNINLFELAKLYSAPLEITYTPMIEEKVSYIKKLFAEKIKKYNYANKYSYAYASKANYYSEIVLTALNYVDMLEVSSAYDIDIVLHLVKKRYIKKGFKVICNGFKNEKYINAIRLLLDKEIDVIPIIENESEYELLMTMIHKPINVGIRYNSDFEAKLIKNDLINYDEFTNRFGFDKDELMTIADKINESKNLNLKALHFHFGGSISNIDNYIKGFSNIMDLYCSLKSKYSTLEYFDFGGGFPVKYSLSFSFDYDRLIDEMIRNAIIICQKYNVNPPHLIGEHGRFTVADQGFLIYKVEFTKTTNDNIWYIINGSLMNMTPDIWGTKQPFTILPINLYEKEFISVCLGGETCDPDDRYFLNNNNTKLHMPKIEKNETLYIAIFAVGAYQEIISGIGGVHHCLIPEGKELIIYKHKNKLKYYKIKSSKASKRALKTLDYFKKRHIKKFYKK